MDRPTYDDIMKERAEFIGPHEPPRGPKIRGSGPYWAPTNAEIRDQFQRIFEDEHPETSDKS